MKGYLHSFESLAAVDGMGLRAAVFLAGCPLRCAYCHNPDTWDMGAGRETETQTLVKKICRYKPYFKETGGVTFSGGEPLLQARFLRELVPMLAAEGIPYALDTSGAVALTDDVRYLLTHAQTVLLDLKFPSDEEYRRYTRHGWEEMQALLNYLDEIGTPVWVRTVVVPGINDREEAIERYVQIIKHHPCVRKYELLGFHTMGFFKYRELGIENPLTDTPPLDSDRKAELQDYANRRLAETATKSD